MPVQIFVRNNALGPLPVHWRGNFIRDLIRSDVYYLDTKGKEIPLPYDVQAAMISLIQERDALARWKESAVVNSDEAKSLRGIIQGLKDRIFEINERRAKIAENLVPDDSLSQFIENAKKVKELWKWKQ